MVFFLNFFLTYCEKKTVPGEFEKNFCIPEEEGQEFDKILSSHKQSILTVKGHNQIFETFLPF